MIKIILKSIQHDVKRYNFAVRTNSQLIMTEEKEINLLNEFPPVSTQEWEETIVRDLKGSDYNKKLIWKTIEGFDVKPY